MTVLKQTTFALFIVLIALAWGAKDWIVWQWRELNADQQIRYLVGFVLVFGLILAYLLTPFIWHNFS